MGQYDSLTQLSQYSNAIGGGLGQSLEFGYRQMRDRRPARVQLTERLQRNEDRIAELTSDNDALREALAELDAHPAIEKVSDLLRKLLG